LQKSCACFCQRRDLVEKSFKSIAFGLILQAGDETLTDARVDQVVELVMERLTTELAAELRA
jgi:phenylalanyl-tRNA synthetase beta subunit